MNKRVFVYIGIRYLLLLICVTEFGTSINELTFITVIKAFRNVCIVSFFTIRPSLYWFFVFGMFYTGYTMVNDNNVWGFTFNMFDFLLYIIYHAYCYRKDNKQTTKFSDNIKTETCPICLESNCNYILPTCEHYYHKYCIKEWLKNTNTCPLCKTIINI